MQRCPTITRRQCARRQPRRPNAECNLLQGGAAEAVAAQLEARLRAALKSRANPFSEAAPALAGQLGRPLLALFDRSFELRCFSSRCQSQCAATAGVTCSVVSARAAPRAWHNALQRLMSFACAPVQRGAAALLDVRAHGGGCAGHVAQPRVDTVAARARRASSPAKVVRGAPQLHSVPSQLALLVPPCTAARWALACVGCPAINSTFRLQRYLLHRF